MKKQKSSEPKLSIIIPVYNNWYFTKACLESIAIHTKEIEFEIIVIDNASSDRTATECSYFGSTLFGNLFHYFRFEQNINFGPACNFGAEKSKSSILFFLNNDTILTKNWLPPLINALNSDDYQIGAVGPLLIYPDSNTVQHLGVCFWIGLTVSHLFEHIPKDSKLVTKQRYLQAITGAALMMPRELFFNCGGFYQKFQNGFEDVDLCARIKDRGFCMTCVPESEIYHFASKSVGRFQQERKNFLLMKERCSHSFHLDFHNWSSREGLEIRISDSGSPYMAIPDRLSIQYINDHQAKKNMCVLFDFIHEEPLWEEGYNLLCSWLESINEFNESIKIRTLQHSLFPKMQIMRKILKLGELSKQTETIIWAKKNIQEHQKRLSNMSDILFTIDIYSNYFKDKGDTESYTRLQNQLSTLSSYNKFRQENKKVFNT